MSHCPLLGLEEPFCFLQAVSKILFIVPFIQHVLKILRLVFLSWLGSFFRHGVLDLAVGKGEGYLEERADVLLVEVLEGYGAIPFEVSRLLAAVTRSSVGRWSGSGGGRR
jgi:hypothetical protein